MAVNNVLSEKRAERKAAATAKKAANWQKRYDKAPAKRQASMTAAKDKKATRIKAASDRKAARVAKRDERKGLVSDMADKRHDTKYTDDDKMFFLQNAKQRNMSLKDYYAKYVK